MGLFEFSQLGLQAAFLGAVLFATVWLVAGITRSLWAPTLVLGAGLLLYMLREILRGMVFNFSLSGNTTASHSMSVDAAEVLKLKAEYEELNRRLFGSDGHGARLSEALSVLQDLGRIDAKVQEVREVVHLLEHNQSAPLQELFQHQARKAQSLADYAVQKLAEVVTQEDFWERLGPLLSAAGVVQSLDPETRVRSETEKARVQEQLRINAGVAQEVEGIRVKGWVQLYQAAAHDFDQALPYRAAMVAALFLVLCLILAGVCLLYHFLRRRLKVPPLVDETSVACCRRRKVGDVRTVFGGDEGRPEVVLADDVRQTVEDMALVALARSARGRKASDLQALPNAIFYGGPGTGKSLTARRLAEACGMDYAIMSGGNVLGLQEEAVPELRRVFGWARRCRKGLLLFIDEAEAFLCCRSKQSNAFLQAAVSFFLSQTGSSSSCLLLILATNRVEDLDAAVLSRMPQHLEFRAPSAQLLEKQVADRQRRLEPKAAERLLSLLKGRGDLGQVLRGFSGRDVQSLFEEFARRWSLEQESGQQRKADAAWLERYFQHRLGANGHEER